MCAGRYAAMASPRHPDSSADPLLSAWSGPYGLPPFEAITAAHFRPAFDVALAAHRAEIEAIAADPAAPSFDNTIAALERSGRDLRRLANLFFLLAGAHTD